MQEYTKQENSRYERKFVTDTQSAAEVVQIIKMQPACFSEIFKERSINNIYFDTPDLSFYFDNTKGKSERVKYRIRWYDDLFTQVKKPVLEVKIKTGQIGRKRQFDLLPFEFTENDFNTDILYDILRKSDIDEDVRANVLCLRPCLVNKYTRRYFREILNTFRVTIDSEVNYYNISLGANDINNRRVDYRNVVIELKYDFDYDNQANTISNLLPFRMSKNSKYVNGIEKFNEIPL